MKARFETIDVTADVGILAYGESLPRLFENAAFGMFSLIAELSTVEPERLFPVEVTAEDREQLLLAWLRKGLYLHEVEGFLFCQFEVDELESTQLKGSLRGARLDRSKHEILRMVKAVTYHQLRIECREGQWQAQVIFDT